MKYVVPKSDQYKVGNETYFRLTIPAEAKMSGRTDKNGTTWMNTEVGNLQLNEKNLKEQYVLILRATCRYILNINDAKVLKKKELIKIILDKMQYEI